MKTAQEESTTMPEITEFLKTTRSLINQLDILKHTNISENVRQITKKAVNQILTAASDYVGGGSV